MNLPVIRAEAAQQRIQQGAVLVDVRNADEYRREHIGGSLPVPLAELTAQGLPQAAKQASCVVFHCKSGMRTGQACAVLAQTVPAGTEAFILENGLDGWKAAGLPVVTDRSQPLELMRQVQIAAGSLALAGALLGWLVSPLFYILCGMVGAGLLTAGITGFCGMAHLLAVMPWNRRATPSA